MTSSDDHLTAEGRILVAALDQPMSSAAVRAAVDVVEKLIGEELLPEDDAGGAVLRCAHQGVLLRMTDGTLGSVYLQIQPTDVMQRFEHLDAVVSGVDADLPKKRIRELLGLPAICEYGNDKYLVGDGKLLNLKYPMYSGGTHVQHVSLVQLDDAGRRRLELAAAKASDGQSQTISITDEDGILALVDAARWQAHLPGWDFAGLTTHFVGEMNERRGMVWNTGSAGYGEWTVELRSKPSRRNALREAEHAVEVTSGRLSLLGYGDLTLAADNAAISLTALAVDRGFDVAPGTYRVRLRELRGNAFEVVLISANVGETRPVSEPVWW